MRLASLSQGARIVPQTLLLTRPICRVQSLPQPLDYFRRQSFFRFGRFALGYRLDGVGQRRLPCQGIDDVLIE